MRLLRILLMMTAASTAIIAQSAKSHRALLLVSVDGLRPDYATRADEHKLKIPFLRKILREGTYADGVTGVLPTVTYSSHTTLLTGVSPTRHGIAFNHPFAPTGSDPNAWYWYREDIRVPTLWEQAAAAGYTVGSVSWPVSVGAAAITYNLPEFAGTRTPEDLKMIRALAGPPLMTELEKAAGPYIADVVQAIPRDWARTRYAVEIIRRKHARFVTVHLAALDHTQHETGPFSEESNAALEQIDRMLAMLADAIQGEDAAGAICIVSDHGFVPVTKTLKLDAAFVKAGLVQLKTARESLATSVISDWIAMPWNCSGSAAIILKDPKDATAMARVEKVLSNLKPTRRMASRPSWTGRPLRDTAARPPLRSGSIWLRVSRSAPRSRVRWLLSIGSRATHGGLPSVQN